MGVTHTTNVDERPAPDALQSKQMREESREGAESAEKEPSSTQVFQTVFGEDVAAQFRGAEQHYQHLLLEERLPDRPLVAAELNSQAEHATNGISNDKLHSLSEEFRSRDAKQASIADRRLLHRKILDRVAEQAVPPLILITGSPKHSQAVQEAVAGGLDAITIDTTNPREETGMKLVKYAFRSHSEEGETSVHTVTRREVFRALSNEEDRPVTLYIGNATNLVAAYEAIRIQFPALPLVIIQTPESTSLEDRTKPPTDEVSPAELRALGRSLRVPYLLLNDPERLSSDAVREEVGKHLIESREIAAHQALRLVTPRVVKRSSQMIDSDVLEVAEEMHAAAVERGSGVRVTGGVAVHMMLGDKRQISRDVDFRPLVNKEDFNELAEALQDLGDTPLEVYADPRNEKLHARSTRISTTRKTGMGEVEVDSVSVRRVRPEYSPFCFHFKYGSAEDGYHFQVQLEQEKQSDRNGSSETAPYLLGVISPEFSIAEKLLASRGRDKGKYDLFDAAGMLSRFQPESALFVRLIERQRYRPSSPELGECDDPATFAEAITTTNMERRLEELGIQDSGIRNSLVRYALWHDKNTDSPLSEVLTPNTLKKVAFVDAFLRGLGKIEHEINQEEAGLIEPDERFPRITDTFNKEQVQSSISGLKDFLRIFARTSLLHQDAYVGRARSSYQKDAPGWVKGVVECDQSEPTATIH